MFKTILVPIDMAHVEAGKSNIDLAIQQASESGSRIILLNVIEEIPGWVAAELPAHLLDQSRQKAQAELEAIANSSGVKPDVMVRSGHPYKTILEVIKEESVNLVILASHRPGLQDYFLGSTAAKVVRHAPCSVLVMR
jgi:nucleotide-binding universal stress UspA family protein